MQIYILIFILILAVSSEALCSDIYNIDGGTSFALSAENKTGAKGGGAVPELMGGLKPSPAIHILPGETATVAEYKGEGTIDSIWIGGVVIPELIIRIYWDGAEVPAVECPLPAFFAHAYRTDINHFDGRFPVLNSSQVFVAPNHGMNCYWKMPFRKSFRITLENTSSAPIDHFYMINGTLRKLDKTAGWFHTQYRETVPVIKGQIIPVLDNIKGAGKYLGTAIYLKTNNDSSCWCEGEVRFYIDGDKENPSINFTGLEDYLCGSFAWNVNGNYHTVSGLYAGLYSVNYTDATLGETGDRFMGYRWHIQDAINFSKDIRVTMFDMGWNITTTAFKLREDDIRTTAYYYLDSPEGQRPETVFDLNIPLSGTDNMIWNWWYYPQVITHGSKLFWTFTTKEGYTGIAKYDEKTQKTEKNYLKFFGHDDHNSAALHITKSGRIVCAYAGGHNTEKSIHIRISKKAYDISEFDHDTELKSSGLTCYSQLMYSGERLNLFYRIDNHSWAWRYSTDEGKTWTEENIIVTAPFQYYCRFTPTTKDGLIRMNTYSNPDQKDVNIRQGFLDVVESKLYNKDMQEIGKAQNTDYTVFEILIPQTEGLTQRMYDIAVTDPDKPLILFAPFSMETGEYIYTVFDSGKTITICEGKRPIWFPKYQGGVSWLTDNRIALAKSDGTKDYIELWSYKKGKAEKIKDIYSEEIGDSTIRNARPICDINGKAFLWHRGEYSEEDYISFDTEAKIYFDK